MPRILFIHPKFLADDLLAAQHDLVHKLFDALTSEGGDALEHPDSFRYKGRRGQLYIRHRKLVEEMDVRAMDHTTPIDRKLIDAEEWAAPDVSPDEVLGQAGELREQPAGRVPLPSTDLPDDYTCPDEFTSVIAGVMEDDLLTAMWKIMRFLVMERSYSMYRSFGEIFQGRRRGSVWVMVDLMLEEIYAHPHDERSPAIAYESVWEVLAGQATGEEKTRYEELAGALEPGKVSLEMRRFLAAVVERQEIRDLKFSAMLAPYID